MPKVKAPYVQVTIRRAVRDKLKKIAKDGHRSMSQQIEKWVTDHKRH